MKFNAIPNSADFLIKKSSIDLTITTTNTNIDNNLVATHVRERYEKHKDLVLNIFRKNHIYNQSYFKEILNNFDLFEGDRNQVIELLLGVSLSNVEFEKRPFSRMTYDIASDLGIK